jgi:calcineurin-like phosphoesterase family protein
MSTFVFSDPHFGHKNMAIKRGFSCEEEQDELIVKNWNNVISKRDNVFLLGDITMEKKNYEILSRLKGQIDVVLGNHDQKQHVREMLKYVNRVKMEKNN